MQPGGTHVTCFQGRYAQHTASCPVLYFSCAHSIYRKWAPLQGERSNMVQHVTIGDQTSQYVNI